MTNRLIPLLLLAACASADGPENSDTIVLEPTVALDLAMGDDDSVLVGRLWDATRWPDGRIAILDADRDVVILIDSTGATIRVIGREGSGPGEFELPAWLERCAGDSLFVYDRALQRMSVLDRDGGFARLFRPAVTSGLQMTCSREGTLAAFDVSQVPPRPPQPGQVQPVLRGNLVVMNATGDSIGGVPDLPLGQNQALGSLAALGIHDAELVVGISSSPLLQRFAIAGAVGSTDSLPLSARPVTDSLYDTELDRMSGLTGATGEMRQRIREMLAAADRPAAAPHYQLLRISDDGTVWLVTSLPTDPATTVLGRRPDGGLLTFTLPMMLEVFEIGGDYLLGKRTDEQGFERLVMWEW